MKELDFDLFMSQEAGRTFYRGLLLFGSLYTLRHYSVSPRLQRCFRFIETELWKSSRCFVSMRPRLRLLYTALLASYVPFFVKQGAFKMYGH